MALPTTTAEAGRLQDTPDPVPRKWRTQYAGLLATGISMTLILATVVIDPTPPQGGWLKVAWFVTTIGLFLMLPLLVFEALRQVRKESLERIEALEARLEGLQKGG